MRLAGNKLNAVDWVVRASIATVFIVIGVEKFSAPSWVKLFAEIGFGEWFRYFTGSVQIAGALLILIPRIARIGIAMLGSTMIGAILVHLFILSTGVGAAIVPAILLGLISIGWPERGAAETESGKSFLISPGP